MASLVTYSDSSSDGEGSGGEEDGDCDENSPPRKKACTENSLPPGDSTHFLPLPSSILGMFSEEDGEDESDVAEHHQGRVRSFPHVRGNWATFVSIPVPYTRDLDNCITAYHEHLQRILDPLTPPGGSAPNFIPMPLDSLHVSLSRTVVIRHHWIEPLTHMLGERLKGKRRLTLGFSSLAFYSNDEKTTELIEFVQEYRNLVPDSVWPVDECNVLFGSSKKCLSTQSFLGVRISKSHDQLCSMVNAVDECFAQYKLQQFHKVQSDQSVTKSLLRASPLNPSFHMSIYWCMGDIIPMVTERHMAELQECWDGLVSEHNLTAMLESMEVTEVRLKTGNKWFSFPLSDT